MFLLFITSNACRILMEWCNIKKPKKLCSILTENKILQKYPTRVKSGSTEYRNLNIWGIIVCKPDMLSWIVATNVSKTFKGPVCDITLVVKNRFYNKVVKHKAHVAIFYQQLLKFYWIGILPLFNFKIHILQTLIYNFMIKIIHIWMVIYSS